MILLKDSFYEPLIQKWMRATQRQDFDYEFSYQTFQQDIFREKGLHIAFDEECFKDIYKMLHEIKYFRFAKANSAYKLEKGYRLLKIANYLTTKSFIKQKQKIRLLEFVEKNKLQELLQNLLITIKNLKRDSQLNEQGLNLVQLHDTFKNKWNDQIPFEVGQFWGKFMQMRKVPSSEILKQLYTLYAPTLQRNIEQHQLKLDLFGIKGQGLNKLVTQIANNNDLHADAESLNSIRQQIEQVKALIMQLSDFRISEFQEYGSLRNQFALRYRSDADITIFTKEPLTKKQEVDLLFKIKYKVESNLPYQRSFVIKEESAKVKSVTLKYNEPNKYGKVVDKIDLVVNNYHGVNNSRMLSMFAANAHVKRLGLLMKLWARKLKLIQPQKFSSYGILLMTIFFLMEKGQIDYVSESLKCCQAKDFKPPIITFNQQRFPPLIENFTQMMKFYSRNGQFFGQNLQVRITNSTNGLISQKVLINMVDPLNHTNPGRIKDIYAQLFYGAIDATLLILKEGKPSEVAQLFIAKF